MIPLGGQGAAFVAASAAFVVDIALSIVVSLVTKPKPAEQLRRPGLLRDPEGEAHRPARGDVPWYRRTLPLAGVALAMVIALNLAF